MRLSGRKTSQKIRDRITREILKRPKGSPAPCLALIRVGEDEASKVYVRGKEKACAEVGLRSLVYVKSEDVEQKDLLDLLERLNKDTSVDGILVQLPLPPQLDATTLQESILPEKDADGLHPLNAGHLALGRPNLIPCTPLGILALLEDYNIPIAGRRVVIVGRSAIVGRPLAQLLSQKGTDATVTLAHSRTIDLPAVTREADILIAAAGRPQFVTGDMIKPGAVVIDVGMHRIEDPAGGKARLVGDVDPAGAKAVVSAFSPVPGGVGPMTIAFLLANTLWAAQRRRGWPGAIAPWAVGEYLRIDE
ncbi:MAG: bifunctional methylenetetrahydrofolate dehydrogenase/methenyltetrahydrofolate cyclohydrolase FolD [Candidatus Eisenbacteria bacterium]|uniref:Bifunctional protein FolD n=1 Tax=Eiseniibacteriota bacterium TaxID=2212470 RepID=A0A948RSU6_UNCEI|nr:bifunctional methylenetetrahydrofolate dehydrogenase/methenyltetrahydrofolate cyclohydrolase FolD [Candidatus Eisenbacteria bacterium]MBU1949617.1 bifunctional methylenetetrahydrofolate dehydrogenase/methenyltetrahydrofolate cyclohydrolase FolD [Candidatus Eisenbacteria bacterium]MBU2690365.1 bifunctional methylenetetrahydrofolate dehydrogenase/methenyltetrahydrofolate cyclohydrolase FolD [Candidatus Eisenbacteria bacterium]